MLKWQLLCPMEEPESHQSSLQGTLLLLGNRKVLLGCSHSYCVTSGFLNVCIIAPQLQTGEA